MRPVGAIPVLPRSQFWAVLCGTVNWGTMRRLLLCLAVAVAMQLWGWCLRCCDPRQAQVGLLGVGYA